MICTIPFKQFISHLLPAFPCGLGGNHPGINGVEIPTSRKHIHSSTGRGSGWTGSQKTSFQSLEQAFRFCCTTIQSRNQGSMEPIPQHLQSLVVRQCCFSGTIHPAFPCNPEPGMFFDPVPFLRVQLIQVKIRGLTKQSLKQS